MAPRSSSAAPVWKKILRFFGVLAFWLLLWQVISLWVNQELLVPSPWRVVQTLRRLVGQGDFWLSILLSLLRVLEGFLMGVTLGSLLAVVTSVSSAARGLLSPLLGILRATPVASFIILALVWIQTNRLPGFISMLMVTPVVWTNVEKGIQQTDRQLLEMAKVYQMSWSRSLFQIRIPSVAPYFWAACTTGLGLAWKSGIAAEVICRPALSIGKNLQDAKVYLETPEVFAWTLMVILLSLSLEKLLVETVRAWNRKTHPEEAGCAGGKI